MAACWKLRIEMLYWRALVQLMYMINGLHLQDLVHARKHDTSMEQLLLMTRCIYLVEITMDVTLMIFKYGN
ncbi:hypothetical protein LOK49_LG15G00912 [Camellia lanceoleosa]|uniref:Uncharacterized protein n=1 Tax=Camellia lanceoleosa TaxID=1840588 RepID=A0ACC0F4U3_9ERIC|nr:hypothetical protein LOK49_LG15G00912 [Camellia lanceoleosa]